MRKCMESRNSHFKSSVQLDFHLKCAVLHSKMSKLLYSATVSIQCCDPRILPDVSDGSVYVRNSSQNLNQTLEKSVRQMVKFLAATPLKNNLLFPNLKICYLEENK